MNLEYLKNLETATIKGFVDKIRDLQYVIFLIIRTSSFKIQVTIEKNDENDKLVQLISNLSLESTVSITGKVIINEKIKLNGLEIIPSSIEVTSEALNSLPIDLTNKDNSLRETRLDYRFLDLRREENNLFFKVETQLEHALREYCITNDFIEIHSPKISSNNAESGSEVFKLDYFGQSACLSQSPQFYKQMAMASGFNKVFEIGPAFRAENSHTSYHATEINMGDIEISWIDSFEDVMNFEEEWLKYAIDKTFDKYGEEITKTYKVQKPNTNVKIPRITFKEAKEILKEKCKYIGEKETDLDRTEEKLLCKYFQANTGSEFVFVTKFPYEARPFYHMLDENGLTNSYDLLFRGIEITTGAQREHRYDILKNQIIDKEIDPADLEFYLDFFKYGCPPHGGFAIGIARIMMQLLNIDNIREATFIYRGPTRLNP